MNDWRTNPMKRAICPHLAADQPTLVKQWVCFPCALWRAWWLSR